LVAALALTWFVFNFAAEASEGSGLEMDSLIALYASRYAVDPKAVQAVIAREQLGRYGSPSEVASALAPPDSGAWAIGDTGTSFGPMQVHKGGLSDASPNPGAIDDWESANGSIADSSGSYDYLAQVGNPTAMEVGVWNLRRCVDAAGDNLALAFTKHNAGLGHADVSDYGLEAYQIYIELGGTDA